MTCRTISVQQVNAEPLPLCVLTAEKPGTQVNMTIDELQAVITEAQIVCANIRGTVATPAPPPCAEALFSVPVPYLVESLVDTHNHLSNLGLSRSMANLG